MWQLSTPERKCPFGSCGVRALGTYYDVREGTPVYACVQRLIYFDNLCVSNRTRVVTRRVPSPGERMWRGGTIRSGVAVLKISALRFPATLALSRLVVARGRNVGRDEYQDAATLCIVDADIAILSAWHDAVA